MERVSVSSSNVVSVGYDEENMILEIEFNNGTYQYYDVPIDVFEELLNSPSIGSYIHHNIRHNFSYAQV